MNDEKEPLESEELEEIEMRVIQGYSYDRLQSELRVVEGESPEGVAITIKDDDIFRWRVKIQGPKDTPYEGGTFALKLYFPSGYPESPPLISFKTKIFHPNVDSFGIVHMDVLLPSIWSPDITVLSMLKSIKDLLVYPKPTEYGDPQVLSMFHKETQRFVEEAKQWTEKYAMENKNIFTRKFKMLNFRCCGNRNKYVKE
ncbi:ubiquitin-conjugating enzyme E2 D4-like [Mytilus trossulus]|uniref:ubiquitin-conjugating enzyme E2 D4-like n=1 Tax=Mytilus trossulus TaxID=6551 RepID=UPI00300740F2